MISTYTTAASIRAVLGISEPEIPDLTINDPIYEVVLKENIRGLDPSMRQDFLTALAVAVPRSAIQERFIDLFQTYSAYQVATQLVSSLPLFAPQTVKDSKTENTRISDPFLGLREAITATLNYLRDLLLEAYADNGGADAPASVVRIMVANVGLGVDPITGA